LIRKSTSNTIKTFQTFNSQKKGTSQSQKKEFLDTNCFKHAPPKLIKVLQDTVGRQDKARIMARRLKVDEKYEEVLRSYPK